MSMFEDFESTDRYDLVWAEGCIPHQAKPLPLMEHIASFVKPGGVLVVSTNNGVSFLSETLRRLFRDMFFPPEGDINKQVQELTPYLEPHLRNLKGMSRPVNDWIMDSIVQPWQDRQLFSIPDAINTIGGLFDVYGSSPRFLTDWRWYKEVEGYNDKALHNYYRSNLNLLDYRSTFEQHSIEFGKRLENLGSRAWRYMCEIERGEKHSWGPLFSLMKAICSHIAEKAPETVLAIQEAVKLLQGDNRDKELKHFPQWWGRGQQYISLIRKT